MGILTKNKFINFAATQMIAVMTNEEMYKEIIEKRLQRKRDQLKEIESIMLQGEVTQAEKKSYMEVKAVILELENVLDLADTLLKQ